MPILDLSSFCDNGTVVFHLAESVDYNETSRTIRVQARGKVADSDQQAVLYIVVVLLFYSCGIIIGIVMYLKKERDEIEEERAYERYLNFKADPARMNRHFCKQVYTTRLREMEEAQKLRQEKNEKEKKVETETLHKLKFSKKRHSHGNFPFLSGSKNTSPTTSRPPNKPQIDIIVDNFDDLVEKGEIIRAGTRDSGGDGDHLFLHRDRPDMDTIMESDVPVLVVQTDEMRACGLASSMPALHRSDSRKSNLIVTEL